MNKRQSGAKAGQNRTFRNACARASTGRLGQHGLDALQIRNLRAHLGQMRLGLLLDLGAGPQCAIAKAKQAANVVQRKPQLAGAQNEAQALHVGGAIWCQAGRQERHGRGRAV